jgi:mRNA interferase RelE/StbE
VTQKTDGAGLPNNYRIFETDQYKRDFLSLKIPNKQKVDTKIKTYVYTQLKEQPYYGKNIKKLRGWNPETWRYRIGDLRLFYSIDDVEKIVFILTIEPRSSAY